jgi:hypothetical protein
VRILYLTLWGLMVTSVTKGGIQKWPKKFKDCRNLLTLPFFGKFFRSTFWWYHFLKFSHKTSVLKVLIWQCAYYIVSHFTNHSSHYCSSYYILNLFVLLMNMNILIIVLVVNNWSIVCFVLKLPWNLFNLGIILRFCKPTQQAVIGPYNFRFV